jgi:hypothetical protein
MNGVTRAVRYPAAMMVAIGLCASARADRDIVFSARYYYPPGNHARSHFHLYRINPDGSGQMQITHGKYDDYGPVWSPDGRTILFRRELGPSKGALCTVPVNGGRVTKIIPLEEYAFYYANYGWSPAGKLNVYTHRVQQLDGYDSPDSRVILRDMRTGMERVLTAASDFSWSLDGHRLYIWLEFGETDLHGRIVEISTGRMVPVALPLRYPVWLDNNTIAGINEDTKDDIPPVCVIGTDGRLLRSVKLKTPRANDGYEFTSAHVLSGIPGDRHQVVLGSKYGRTAFTRLLVNLDTGQAYRLVIGDNLVWSPDGKRFVTAPEERDLQELGDMQVWVAPLRLYSARGRLLRTLTQGTVYTSGADWRKPERKANEQ